MTYNFSRCLINTKMNREEALIRLKSIHGDRYDYTNLQRMTLFDAFLTEQKVLQNFEEHKYVPTLPLSGRTECFLYDKDIIENIIENMRV